MKKNNGIEAKEAYQVKHVIFSEVFPIAGLTEGILSIGYWLVLVLGREYTFKRTVWSDDTVFCDESWSTKSIEWISIK